MARKPTAKQLYKLKNEFLKEHGLEEVSPYEFYRDVFPEDSLEIRGDYETRRPNAIFTLALKNAEGKRFGRNSIMFDDLQELEDVIGAEFAVTSPVTYSGKNRTADNARQLWGFCIDLDGVEMNQLTDLLHQIENDILPEPTYLVNSGHGFHVYYLLEDPVPLYKHLHEPLNRLKEGLTNMVWNRYTSVIKTEERQFQGIFQGFRMPGSQSKLGNRYPVVAFRLGRKRMLQYLNDFVSKDYQLKEWDDYRLTLEEAKEKYPEWYERRIVQGIKTKSKWDIAGKVNGDNPYALYDWWLAKIQDGAFDGNRYNCIATLITYAVKCDVDRGKVLSDALELVPWLNSLTKTENNEFTVQDVYDAMDFYSDSYATYSIKAIESRTKIQIERNKRNGRKRSEHVKLMNFIRDEINGKRDTWREGNGRPVGSGTAEMKVKMYRLEYPEASVTEVARALKLSRTTVYKWWDLPMNGTMRKIKPSKALSDAITAELRADAREEALKKPVRGYVPSPDAIE